MIFIIELLCLITASFFAGMETGLLSADKLKIYSKKEKKVLWAKSAHFLLEKPERLLGTTLIGTNVSVVTSTVILNSYLRKEYSVTVAVMGSLFLAIIYLLFSEIIPKTFFRKYADTVTVRLTPLLRFFFYVFLPVSFIMNTIVKVFLFIMGQGKSESKMPHSRDDFRLLMHLSSRESGFEYDDFRMIDDILDFGLILASESMIPLHQVSCFDIDTKESDLIINTNLSSQRFFPIYRDRAENIIGYIDVEDFCTCDSILLNQILREPFFFPEVKPLSDLLSTMIENELSLVFLCDEYGGISGIVTHQEIASEIMGSIPGHEQAIKEDVIRSDKNTFIVSGNTDLQYLAHILEITIKKSSNQTLGGFLCERLGVIPKNDDQWIEGKIKYTIIEADKLHVRKVRIELLQENEEFN